MLTNRAVFPSHGARSIAFILANCQNTIKKTKEAETDFPAFYQAILCTVEFSTVLKNCEFASAKSWRFCLQRDVPYFRTLSLPQPALCQKWVLSNASSCCQHLVPAFHTPGIKSSPWDPDSCVAANREVWGHTHTELCLPSWRFGVGRFAHSKPLLSQKLLQHLNAISVWGGFSQSVHL